MKKKLTEVQGTGKQLESLNTQLSAGDTESSLGFGEPIKESRKLVDIEQQEGTPFTIVSNPDAPEEIKSFIAVGLDRLTDPMPTKECKDMIERRDWGLIVQLQVYLATRVKRDKDVV